MLVARTSHIVNLFDNQIGLAGWHDHHDDLIRHCANGDVARAAAMMRDHIAEIQDAKLIVQVVRVGNRREVYR